MEENTLLYITLIHSYYNKARLYILFYIYSFIYNTYIIVTISVYNFKISPFHPIPRIVSKLQGPPGCQRNAICRGEVQSVWGLYFICPYWHVWRHFTLIWLLVPNSHRPQPSLQISPEICLRNVCFSRVCKNWLRQGSISCWGVWKSVSDSSVWTPWCSHACSPSAILPREFVLLLLTRQSTGSQHSQSPENHSGLLSHDPTQLSPIGVLSEPQLSCLHSSPFSRGIFIFCSRDKIRSD